MQSARLTDEQTSAEQQAAYARMTSAERVQAGMALRDTAWTIKRAALQQLHPDWPPDRLDREVRRSFVVFGR